MTKKTALLNTSLHLKSLIMPCHCDYLLYQQQMTTDESDILRNAKVMT